jgi:two-component system OmpR family sensor kinase
MLERFSLRARLIVVVTVLAAVGLIVADIVTYTSLRSFLFHRTDRSLDAARFAVEHGGGASLAAAAPSDFIQLRDPTGNVTDEALVPQFRGSAPPAPPKLPRQIVADRGFGGPDHSARYFTTSSTDGKHRWRVRVSGFGPGTLVLAAPLTSVDSTLHRLFLIELLVTFAVLIAVAALGFWIVRAALRPLDAIAETADAIAAGDLSQRVERAEPRTEVGRLGIALNAMLAHIEASDRRLRRFIADASHELRTPLAAVRAYAELFGRGADRRPDDLARSMSGITRESERMTALVDDLLLLARLDEGRPLDHEPLQLDEVVCEAVDAARAVDPERPITLEAQPAAVAGDRDRLRQVVDNLLTNARTHTRTQTPVHVRVETTNGRAVLGVADEGPGLPADEAERVFERFYRADESRARANGGVGLGLAIVAAIAEAHGGRASVDSTPGQGATFVVSLPLAGNSADGDANVTE